MSEYCNTFKGNKFQTPGAKPYQKDNFHARRTIPAPVFKLYVRGLADQATNNDLQTVFEAYCPHIKKAEICEGKRFGFVSYYKEVDLQMVLSKIGPEGILEVAGSTWRVERAVEKPRSATNTSRTTKQTMSHKATKTSGVVLKSNNNGQTNKKPSTNKLATTNKTPFKGSNTTAFKKPNSGNNFNRTNGPPPRHVHHQQQLQTSLARTTRDAHTVFEQPIASHRITDSVPNTSFIHNSLNTLASQYSRSSAAVSASVIGASPTASSHERPSDHSLSYKKRSRYEFELGECDEYPLTAQHAYRQSGRGSSDHDSTTGDDQSSISSSADSGGQSQSVKWSEHYEPY